MSFIDDDKLKEECGVFGIIDTEDAAAHTALGLHALQHRGQEAAGIISYDKGKFNVHKVAGLVSDNFSKQSVIDHLKGNIAIGHVRYSTAGGNDERNIQPLFAELNFGGMALAHNGNLTNTEELKKQLINQGSIFHSTADTEVFVHLIATNKNTSFIDRLVDSVKYIKGAYSIVMIAEGALMGMRDPFGVRPLVLGKLGNSYILASESCALDIIGAELIRDIEPGELVVIKNGEITSIKPFAKTDSKFCIFEFVYFARPDSVIENKHVYTVRKQIGIELAKEAHIDADIIVPVPDSGVPSAIGYAAQSGLPFELGIIRNHYVGRTFIEPTDQVRHLGVKLKHNASSGTLKGKRVILIDDSIVRGTTSKKIVELVREAGAKEVHMRIAAPPTANPCFYGIDTPCKSNLLAANMTVAEMAKFINVDSLAFISINGLYKAVGEAKREEGAPQYCDACFTGDYPIDVSSCSN